VKPHACSARASTKAPCPKATIDRPSRNTRPRPLRCPSSSARSRARKISSASSPAGIPERGREIDALFFPALPEGLPADLLERRPDIRQAEQNLIAANADIGVAKAAYFPRVSLTGLLGLESGELSDLFKGPSRTWSYGAGVTLPIFNAGRIRNQVAQSEAFQREALSSYERSIIVAFQEVENALVDRSKLAQTRDAQARNVAALQRFRDLAALRYREGATIYLEVANAEQSLFNAQLAYVATQSQLFQSYSNLYKAMGGGWCLRDSHGDLSGCKQS